MPEYRTELVKNLSTGEPFVFDVSPQRIERFENQKKMIEKGELQYYETKKDLVLEFEFSLFPAYQELLKIFFENGFTEELLSQILSEFGLFENQIEKILEDGEYVYKVRPWFESITCDGQRAARTLKIVYCRTLSFFRSPEEKPGDPFLEFGAVDEYFIDEFKLFS